MFKQKNKSKWYPYQFHHRMTNRHGPVPRFTAAVEMPSKKKLIKLIKDLADSKVGTIKLSFGLARVNPKDRYNKKLGRELSFNRKEQQEFEIRSSLSMTLTHQDPPYFIEIKNDTSTNVEFRGIWLGSIVHLYFTVNKLDKVVLGNVNIHSWPEYSYDGYKVKPERDWEGEAMGFSPDKEKKDAV